VTLVTADDLVFGTAAGQNPFVQAIVELRVFDQIAGRIARRRQWIGQRDGGTQDNQATGNRPANERAMDHRVSSACE
jgi:hypothetical protein